MFSDKRSFIAVIIVGIFTMTSFVLGQAGTQTRADTNAGQQQTNRLAVLTKALGLSDAQVTTIRNAMQTAQPSLRKMAQDVKAKRQALKAAASAANPNSAAVGSAFLALRSSEAQLRSGRKQLQATIHDILTLDQQKSMSALKVVRQARQARFRQFAHRPMATGLSDWGH